MSRLVWAVTAGVVLLATVASTVAIASSSAREAGTTYAVFLGEQSPGPASFKVLPATLNQFIPSRVTIAAGDNVTFSSASFHTVSYVPRPPALIAPDPKKGTYPDSIVDSAGQPFYFVGQPKFIYNPLAFGPYGPKAIAGKTPASSGVLSPPGRKPVSATYAFPKAGVYKLLCNVHPGMVGTVVVKPAGSAVPKTPAQVTAEALGTTAKAWTKAKALHAGAAPPKNTVFMGLGGKTTLLAFYPKVLKVKAGTTVTFVNRSPSEVHNIVFGPPKYVEKFAKQTDFLPQGPTAPNQVTPILVYGSDPKPLSYDGTNHGNGFFATPLTVGAAAVPLPKVSRVTFTAPGTYKYFCFIHGVDMGGTIVVTP